jgi:hypothetical protein
MHKDYAIENKNTHWKVGMSELGVVQPLHGICVGLDLGQRHYQNKGA